MKIEKYKDPISTFDKIKRKIWNITSIFLFLPFSSLIFNPWRVLLLKLFGAKIEKGSIVYASSKIPSPWNLTMGEYSCLGPRTELHIGKVTIGSKVTISQGSYLCTGSHDTTYLNKPFISKPITLNNFVWVAADSFIGPGVTIGEGAVVGARSAVFKDVKPWTIVGGNPAKFIKKRILNND